MAVAQAHTTIHAHQSCFIACPSIDQGILAELQNTWLEKEQDASSKKMHGNSLSSMNFFTLSQSSTIT